MRKLSISILLPALAFLAPTPASADDCPTIEAGLTKARLAINEFQSNGRAPAGADCAHELVSSHVIDPKTSMLQLVSFYKASSDIQRRAAEKRKEEGDGNDTNRYLQQEIRIRQKFLNYILKSAVSPNDRDVVRRATVEHISYLSSALAMQSKYEQVANELGNRDADIIDDEALRVWLQAVWSCAKWDGNKADVCSRENRAVCRDKIEIFLEAVDEMKSRNFGRQTKRDIEQLRQMKSQNGCFSRQEQQ
jgi:hypothetical protein